MFDIRYSLYGGLNALQADNTLLLLQDYLLSLAPEGRPVCSMKHELMYLAPQERPVIFAEQTRNRIVFCKHISGRSYGAFMMFQFHCYKQTAPPGLYSFISGGIHTVASHVGRALPAGITSGLLVGSAYPTC